MKNVFDYHEAVVKLRQFFHDKKGFIEVPAQSRLSILAACEDPKNVTTFTFNVLGYPLPQTGQMWLEHELLKNPTVPGFFCLTTSYRDEPNPIEGRHEKIFPMFEFEAKGDIDALKNLENQLLLFLGFEAPESVDYEDICRKWNIEEIDAKDEERMNRDIGPIISLEKFPLRTDPFWNMKQVSSNSDLFEKVDVILHGMETIGSAERATDVEKMREHFLTISQGKYAELLFQKFGRTRVQKELEDYLSLEMFQRFGGGIGITRLVRAMKLAGLLSGKSARSLSLTH